MSMELPLLALGIVFALVVGIVIWFIASSRASDKQRDDLQAKRMSHQPWDAQSADGRGNR